MLGRTCSMRFLHFYARLGAGEGLPGACDANPKMNTPTLAGVTITPPSSPHCPILLGPWTAPGAKIPQHDNCPTSLWTLPLLWAEDLLHRDYFSFPFGMNFLLFLLIDVFSPRFVSFSSPVWSKHISIPGARDSYWQKISFKWWWLIKHRWKWVGVGCKQLLHEKHVITVVLWEQVS